VIRSPHVHAAISERLRSRRPEIERTILTRVYSIADPSEVADPAYADGLRAAVSAALDYGLDDIGCDDDRAPPVPAVLLTQARLAARNGVNLDTVLRRYFAGYALLSDLLVAEIAQGESPPPAELKRLLRALAIRVDRLLAVVGEEHAREAESHAISAEQRRAEHVRRLLAGELLDTSALAYRFDDHHLGLVAEGTVAPPVLEDLARSLDRRLLSVRPDEHIVWAWLGGRRPLDPADLASRLAGQSTPGMSVALGEPAENLEGWRLTHRQAAAALAVARRSGERLVRYADVALDAAIVHDDLLATSLRRLYLEPLERERDGGSALRQTLRGYFAAGRNVSSTAAAVGVSRRTVNNRLKAIELALGLPLSARAAELEAALRLEELDASSDSTPPGADAPSGR
jgi:DNA-binding PucR family transcriptional regulator